MEYLKGTYLLNTSAMFLKVFTDNKYKKLVTAFSACGNKIWVVFESLLNKQKCYIRVSTFETHLNLKHEYL